MIIFLCFVSLLLLLTGPHGLRRLRAALSRSRDPKPPTAPGLSDYASAVFYGWVPLEPPVAAVMRQLRRYVAAEEMPLSRTLRLAPTRVTIGVTDRVAASIVEVASVVEAALVEEIREAAVRYGRRQTGCTPVVEIVEDAAARPGLPTIRSRYDDDGPWTGEVCTPGRRRIDGQSPAVAGWRNSAAPPSVTDVWSVPAREDDLLPATHVLDDEGSLTELAVTRVLLLPDGRKVPVPVSGKLIVGRGHGVDVELLAPQVSRLHARVHATGAVAYIEDLSSANGTFLNGRVVTTVAEVHGGDEISLGDGGPSIRVIELV